MTENEFVKELEKINIIPTIEQLEQLNQYYELVIEYNKIMNLTGITDKKEFYLKHFYDSLTINKIIDLSKINDLCDIGSGAGFPGIVIKILFPNINIKLIDSLNKRVNFLNKVIESLNLKNIVAIHERIEEYAKKNIERYDLVTARAVTSLNVLLEYSIPMLKINGKLVAMKANMLNEPNYQKALVKLNASISNQQEFYLPIENSKRTLILINKDNKTSGKYPRTNNEIKKNPL